MPVEVGSKVAGKVSRVTEFGAFVELTGGETGLIHISHIAHEFVRDVRQYLSEGDEVEVKVLGYDNKGRLDLSLKDTIDAPPPAPRRSGPKDPTFEQKLRRFMKEAKERQQDMYKTRRRR